MKLLGDNTPYWKLQKVYDIRIPGRALWLGSCGGFSLLVKGVFSAAAVIKGPGLLIGTTASREREPTFLPLLTQSEAVCAHRMKSKTDLMK